MNAAKSKKKPGNSAKSSSPSGGIWRRFLFVLAFVALASGACLLAWSKFGSKIRRDAEYLIRADSIEITTPTPPWIRTDIRAEVVRDGGLEGMSTLDRQLTVKVAQAFASHSWVQAVKHVSKHPQGRVIVDLEYRRPVAMVEVVENGEAGLLPVDGSGVLLSPADFTADDVSDYIRISVPNSRPVGTLGEPWGDTRVHQAACLAAVLQKQWKELALSRIAINSEGVPGGSSNPPSSFELRTRKGTRVLWGAAPDPEDAVQVELAAGKMQRLIERVETLGPLDEITGDPAIDLRLPNESMPATAGQSTAGQSTSGRWE